MNDIVQKGGAGNLWRIVGWGTAVALLAAPFVAMQLHADGVNWTASDFILAAVIFATIGGLLELAVKLTPDRSYRGAVALALLGSLLVVWSNLAVGIVGSEDNAVNQLFFAALLIGLVAALLARFRPGGMSWAMIATAALIETAFAIAASFPTDEPHVSHAREFVLVSVFSLIFLGSAVLFRRAEVLQSSSSS